jgi:hypothetical protein
MNHVGVNYHFGIDHFFGDHSHLAWANASLTPLRPPIYIAAGMGKLEGSLYYPRRSPPKSYSWQDGT